MKLSSQKAEELQLALIDAFPTTASLEQMVSFKLSKNLRAIAGEGNLQDIVFKLIRAANSEGWVENLVNAAYISNPGNQELSIFVSALDATTNNKPGLNQDQIEREYKYLINKGTFKKFETFIKNTTFDSKYKLGEVTEVVNYDYYFDTIDQQLFNKKASLRFRIKIKDNQKELFITLKSEQKTNGNIEESPMEKELHQRLEIEGYPNIETLKKVQSKLSQLGVLNSEISDINDFDLIYNGLHGIFSSWNLKEFFKLENKRMLRSIIDSGNKIAEIALDKVDLKIDNQDSTFYEIEVEAKVNGATKKLSEIVQFLKQEFSTQLIPSGESKYERGLKFLRTKPYDKIETKLIVLNQNEDDLPDYLKSLYPNNDYNLELDVKSTITDIYYDTKNKDLFKNKLYLRIRDQGKGQKIVTLRENNLTDVQDKQDKPMTSRSEIKGSIDQDSLTRVIDSLIASKLIKKQKNNFIIFYGNTEDFLKYYGLEEVVKIQTERVLFSISHKKESFVSMKYDVVKFIFPKITKTFDLKLIEFSTSDPNNINHLEAIKYYLMHHLKRKEFNLKESNEPKYKIGLDLLKDYQISQNKLFERKPFENLFSTRIKNLSIAQTIVLICITLLILMIIGLTITAVPLPR